MARTDIPRARHGVNRRSGSLNAEDFQRLWLALDGLWLMGRHVEFFAKLLAGSACNQQWPSDFLVRPSTRDATFTVSPIAVYSSRSREPMLPTIAVPPGRRFTLEGLSNRFERLSPDSHHFNWRLPAEQELRVALDLPEQLQRERHCRSQQVRAPRPGGTRESGLRRQVQRNLAGRRNWQVSKYNRLAAAYSRSERRNIAAADSRSESSSRSEV